MKKKMIPILALLMLLLILSMAACGQAKATPSPAAAGSVASVEATPVATPEATPETTPVATPEATPAAEPVTLKFLYIWPEHQTVMEKSIKSFEDTNPNIKVEVSVTPWDKVFPQLQTAIASGDTPDVSFMWPGAMGSWVALDAALDLTPYMEKDADWKNSFLSDSVLVPGQINGKLYAVPFRGTATYIVYNKKMFEANGWVEPKTVEELETTMDAMLAKKVTPFAIAGKPDGFQLGSISSYFYNYNLLNAGILTDAQYILGRKVDIKGPYADAFKRTRDWLKKGYFGASPLALAREEAQSAFFTEKGAMLMCNNNELMDLRKLAGDKFTIGFMSFPAPANAKEGIVPGGFDGFFVLKSTKYPEQSVALLKGLTSPEVQSMWASDALSAMVVKGVTYGDKDLEKMASLLSMAGKYNVGPDYNQGDLNTRNAQAFADFLMKDSITPEALEQTWNDNTTKAIADAVP